MLFAFITTFARYTFFMKKILLSILLLPLLAFSLHKFYVSSIRVEHNKQEQTVQITLRIFTDDLERAVNDSFKSDIVIDSEKDTEKIEELLHTYINNTFNVKINNELAALHYLGKEFYADMTYLYIEIEKVKDIGSIEIKDSMLMETFPDQKNIINLFINGVKKTFVLTVDNNLEKLIF